MTDHQYLAAANSWVLGIINVSVSYYFILKYGLIGAAIGIAGSYAIVNLIHVVNLGYLESLFPFIWKFLKPLTAGIVATGTMVVVSWYLNGLSVLLGRAIVGIEVDRRCPRRPRHRARIHRALDTVAGGLYRIEYVTPSVTGEYNETTITTAS